MLRHITFLENLVSRAQSPIPGEDLVDDAVRLLHDGRDANLVLACSSKILLIRLLLLLRLALQELLLFVLLLGLIASCLEKFEY